MHELHNEPNPLEMRLGPSCISWKKGCYIGQEVISRLDSYDKVARLLMGFHSPQALADAGTQGHKLFIDGRPIGKITSSVAVAEGCIGLALVKRSAALPGRAHLQIDQSALVIDLLDRPFWAPAH
jgi:folate-binding protein YgfZ